MRLMALFLFIAVVIALYYLTHPPHRDADPLLEQYVQPIPPGYYETYDGKG